MLTSLAFILAGSFGLQDRTFSFLSYQDTVFAVYNRGWRKAIFGTDPLHQSEIKLKPLGMGPINGTFRGIPETWDSEELCYNVACDDFEHVLGCFVTPRYTRPAVKRPDLAKAAKALALIQFRAEFEKRSLSDTFTSVKEPNVYSVDLDGKGQQEILVDISAKSKAHSYGLAFMYSRNLPSTTLAFKADGWPRILSVVDLAMDRESGGAEVVIVGGTTSFGKYVAMWTFIGNRPKKVADYDSPR